MSENTNTNEAVDWNDPDAADPLDEILTAKDQLSSFELNDPSTKTMRMFVPEDDVNRMLATLGVSQLANAEDLDYVIIEVDHSPLMKRKPSD